MEFSTQHTLLLVTFPFQSHRMTMLCPSAKTMSSPSACVTNNEFSGLDINLWNDEDKDSNTTKAY